MVVDLDFIAMRLDGVSNVAAESKVSVNLINKIFDIYGASWAFTLRMDVLKL